MQGVRSGAKRTVQGGKTCQDVVGYGKGSVNQAEPILARANILCSHLLLLPLAPSNILYFPFLPTVWVYCQYPQLPCASILLG